MADKKISRYMKEKRRIGRDVEETGEREQVERNIKM